MGAQAAVAGNGRLMRRAGTPGITARRCALEDFPLKERFPRVVAAFPLSCKPLARAAAAFCQTAKEGLQCD